MFNKKIAVESAVGIIIIIAIAFGGFLFLQGKKAEAPVINKEIINPNNLPSGNNKNLEIANPASVYCEQNGGKTEIVTAADGSQSGNCVFADGSKCEEWAFMRGECKSGNAQNQIDTSNWKIYQNNNSNFEVKYPEGYEYVDNNNFGEEPEFIIKKDKNGKEYKYRSFSFGVGLVSDFLGGDSDKFKNPDIWEKEQNKLANKYDKINTNGEIAYIPRYDTQNFKEYIFFIKRGDVYDMYNIYVNKQDQVAEQIFSTFKFVK